MRSPPTGMSAPGLVPVVPPDLAGLLHQRSGQYPWCEGGHHHSSWPAARDDDAGTQPNALITVPQPSGLYGPLLYPTSTTGTAGLALDFTVVHPVGRRGAEYTCDENALHRAYRTEVTKHHEWLQAKNYWFVPVVAATSGALHPETLRLLYDFARLKTDAAEQHAVANPLRSPLTPEQLCQRRGATFARLRMEAQLYSLRQLPRRVEGGPVPIAAPGRSFREIGLVRGLSCGTPPRHRFHHQRELISDRQFP